jgi:methyltransferase (TIGR00027 family)
VLDDKPSASAWRVAVARAAHQLLDSPKVFDDPLALRIVGADVHQKPLPDVLVNRRRWVPRSKFLRAFLCVRSRVAEDELAAAVQRGVRQYVILGAGLDTFAYRNPYPGLRVFEVDHPATQAWKRELLTRASITVPEALTFVPINFERQRMLEALRTAGLNVTAPTFFGWLGVTMYIAETAVFEILSAIGSLPRSSGVTFDYALPAANLGLLRRLAASLAHRHAERRGEPWITFFAPPMLTDRLAALGFHDIRDLGRREINARYFSGRSDGLRVGELGRLMTALV